MEFELYTDGGCSVNPGIGGYAYVIRLVVDEMAQSFVRSGFKDYTTNNHMELKAIVEGLKALRNSKVSVDKVTVTSDSSYCINPFTKGWIHGWRQRNFMRDGKPMPNRDLWLELDELLGYFKSIEWVWVKGHNGHRFNEICDTYAVRSYREQAELFERIEVLE